MGVEVGPSLREVGEFGDRPVNGAAAAPEIVEVDRTGDPVAEPPDQPRGGVEVADPDEEDRAERAEGQRRVRPDPPGRHFGSEDQPRHATGDAEGGGRDQRRDGGHRQIEGDLDRDTGQFHQHRDEVLPEVVIVDVAIGVPRIERREVDAAEDTVEVRQLHRLLAAPVGVPEVGILQPQKEKERPREQENPFRCEDTGACPAQGFPIPAAPVVGRRPGRGCAAQQRDQQEGQGELPEAQARPEPDRVGEEEPTEQLAEAPATVGEVAAEPQGEGQRQHAEEFDRQQPEEGRPDPVVADRAVPGVVAHGGEAIDELGEEERLAVLRFRGAMGRNRATQCGGEEPAQFLGAELADLLVDDRARVVVDGEALVHPAIVELEGAECGQRGVLVDLDEAELLGEEQLVIVLLHRVAPGQARDRTVEPIGRLDDVIGLRHLPDQVVQRRLVARRAEFRACAAA